MRVALYARVSSDVQKARGTIGSQIEALRARAATEGHQVVKECLDNGHSGARLDRPGLDALRDAAVSGSFEAVLVLSPDRLSRNFAYQMVVIDELRLHGVPVHFLDTPALGNDPQTRLLTQIQGVVAEYERAKIMERHRRGKLYRARLGEIVWWKPAYGYHRIPRTPERLAHYVVYEPQAVVVRRIFDDAVSDGLSLRQIALGLSRDGIPSPGGVACWSTSTLGYVLSNETYVGRAYYNQTETVPAPPGSRRATRQRPRPREEWIQIDVPAIITEEAFAAAGKVSRENQRFSLRRAEPGAWLLRGLVVCGVCGVRVNCQGKTDRTGTRYHYYRCRKHDPLVAGGEEHRCPERNIRAQALDDFVLEKVKQTLRCPEVLLAGESALVEAQPAPDEELLGAQLKRIEGRVKTAEEERRRLLDLYQTGLVEFDDLKRRIQDIDLRREKACEERDALIEQRQALIENGLLRGRIGDFGSRVLDALDGLDFDQCQRLLRLVVEEVRVTGWKVEIRFSIPLDEPPDDRPDPDSGGPDDPDSAERVSSKESLRPIGDLRFGDEETVRELHPVHRHLLGRSGLGVSPRQTEIGAPPTQEVAALRALV